MEVYADYSQLTVKKRKKKKEGNTPLPKSIFPKENVSSPVWKENKNEVGKNKWKTQYIP